MHIIYFHVWTYLYLYVVPNFPSIQTLISGLWTTVVAQLHLFNFQLQFLFVDPFSPCGIFGPDTVALDYAVILLDWDTYVSGILSMLLSLQNA